MGNVPIIITKLAAVGINRKKPPTYASGSLNLPTHLGAIHNGDRILREKEA